MEAPGYGDSPRLEPARYRASAVAEIAAALIDMKGSNDEPALPLLPRIETLGLPVLLIASTEPPEYDDLRERALARFRGVLPSAEVVSVSAGHGILQEAGDDVRRILFDWLARLD